tara:strand:+ start:1325 stop:2041 length:717 start_codon:yes stop_codon:yes gene_type:complete
LNLRKSEINGIKFWHRPGYSDLKTFEEVIGRKTYLKRGMTIVPGDRWLDAGANVGAFALQAASLGAEVVSYEPDPICCELIERNLKLNNLKADIKQAALVPDDRKFVRLFIGNNGNVWRNSIVKQWNKESIKVPCLNFDNEAKGFSAAKIDIEGAEMPILEATKKLFEKMVYEWSFDIDPSLTRLWKLLERQKAHYRVEAAWNSIRFHDREFTEWQKKWFPACTNVFCYEKPDASTST